LSDIISDPQSGQFYLAAVPFLALGIVLAIDAVRLMNKQRSVGLFQLVFLVPLAYASHIYFLSLMWDTASPDKQSIGWTLASWATDMLVPALKSGSAAVTLWGFVVGRREAAFVYLGVGAALFHFALMFGGHWLEALVAIAVLVTSGLMIRRAVAQAD